MLEPLHSQERQSLNGEELGAKDVLVSRDRTKLGGEAEARPVSFLHVLMASRAPAATGISLHFNGPRPRFRPAPAILLTRRGATPDFSHGLLHLRREKCRTQVSDID
jgi:hypothetical protein